MGKVKVPGNQLGLSTDKGIKFIHKLVTRTAFGFWPLKSTSVKTVS